MGQERHIDTRIQRLGQQIRRLEGVSFSELSAELNGRFADQLARASTCPVIQLLSARIQSQDPSRAIVLWRHAAMNAFPELQRQLRLYDLSYLRGSLAALLALRKIS